MDFGDENFGGWTWGLGVQMGFEGADRWGLRGGDGVWSKNSFVGKSGFGMHIILGTDGFGVCVGIGGAEE